MENFAVLTNRLHARGIPPVIPIQRSLPPFFHLSKTIYSLAFCLVVICITLFGKEKYACLQFNHKLNEQLVLYIWNS
jgi:hypothetical protein